MACMVCITVGQAVAFLDWEGFVDHRLGGHRLLGNHGWFVTVVVVVVVLAAIDGGSVVSHGFWACALFNVLLQRYRCIT